MRSPIKRYGGKGRIACFLVPHFAATTVYAEPCFGAGSVFYRIPAGLYQREAINDQDASIVTFFRVLRERPEELVRVCEATPYALDEFRAVLTVAEDPLEEARRVWIRSRQSFSAADPLGAGAGCGRWSRPTGRSGWRPSVNDNTLARLPELAARLRQVVIDHLDAADFVDRWGQASTMVYADPPYVHSTRNGLDYRHEMTDEDHRRLAAALHAAVRRGSHVAISGYPCDLYELLYAGWRRVEIDTAATCARGLKGSRRTEVLWMSYPAALEHRHVPQLALGLESQGGADAA